MDEVDAWPVGAPAHEDAAVDADGASYPRAFGIFRPALTHHARVVTVVEVAALLAAAPCLRRGCVARGGVLLLDAVATAVLLPPRRAPVPLLAEVPVAEAVLRAPGRRGGLAARGAPLVAMVPGAQVVGDAAVGVSRVAAAGAAAAFRTAAFHAVAPHLVLLRHLPL